MYINLFKLVTLGEIMASKKVDESVVLPCGNEEKAVEGCIIQIKGVLEKENINGEIIVSDSSI
jgi:hypothetical protein